MKFVYRYLLNRFTEPSQQATARTVLYFSITEAVISFTYGLLHPWLGFHVPRLFFFGFSLTILAGLFLFRTRLSLHGLAHLSIAVMWGGFCLGIAYSGGVFSLVLPWLALMPLMANLLMGLPAARTWLVISAASVVFFFFFFKDAQPNLDSGGDVRSAMAHVGLVAIVFLFSYLFYRAQAKLIRQVEEKNAYLQQREKEILAQNETLRTQQYEIQTQSDFIQRQNTLLIQQNVRIDKMNELLTMRVAEIAERTRLLERHWKTLLAISKSRAINVGQFDEAIRHITRVVAESLHTERVSIWAYQPDRKSISCLVLYDAVKQKHSAEEELLLEKFPRYFEALEKQDVIPADNAEENPQTFEFRDDYLRPRHIVSMMDTPYFLDGKLAGVLCCESVDTQRHWSPEDILFAQSLSDIISLAYRASQRRDYENRLRQNSREIEKINQSLEQRVRERTAALENQNKQLAEYAFINSHLLRGPLSRLMGLINLIELLEIEESEKELVQHLKDSAQELDEVVRKISQAIAEGKNIHRDKLGPEAS